MPESVPLFRHKPASDDSAPSSADEGLWELDLWDGSAWFSEWFYQKLQWSPEDQRKTLVDLEPHLPPDAWAALLLKIREHLEQRTPFETEFCVQLPGGGAEWWLMQGHTENNTIGQPICLVGSMREVSAASRLDTAESGS